MTSTAKSPTSTCEALSFGKLSTPTRRIFRLVPLRYHGKLMSLPHQPPDNLPVDNTDNARPVLTDAALAPGPRGAVGTTGTCPNQQDPAILSIVPPRRHGLPSKCRRARSCPLTIQSSVVDVSAGTLASEPLLTLPEVATLLRLSRTS